MASAAVETFVAKQLDLLELERDAEVEERRYGRRPSSRGRPGSSRALTCSDPGGPSGARSPRGGNLVASLGGPFWLWTFSFFGPKSPSPNAHSEILPLPSSTPSACPHPSALSGLAPVSARPIRRAVGTGRLGVSAGGGQKPKQPPSSVTSADADAGARSRARHPDPGRARGVLQGGGGA